MESLTKQHQVFTAVTDFELKAHYKETVFIPITLDTKKERKKNLRNPSKINFAKHLKDEAHHSSNSSRETLNVRWVKAPACHQGSGWGLRTLLFLGQLITINEGLAKWKTDLIM